jgi:hypothetical protein
VFKAIICVRWQALHQQNVSVNELIEGVLQRRIVYTGHVQQKPIGETSSDHCPD